MRARNVGRILGGIVIASLPVVGCRVGYELDDDQDLRAAAGSLGASGGTGGGTATGGDATGGLDSGGTGGTDSGGTGGTDSGGTGGTDGLPSSEACRRTTGLQRIWSFEVDEEGWQFSADEPSTVTWTGSQGNPDTGALQVDTSGEIHLFSLLESEDLTGRVISAWIYIESGTDVRAQVFSQTGGSWAWADGETVLLSTGIWTCITLDVNAPQYAAGAYDPSKTRRLGVHIWGSESFRSYVDQMMY